MVVKSMDQCRIISTLYMLYKHLKTNLGYSISSRQPSMINQKQSKSVISRHKSCSLILLENFSAAVKLLNLTAAEKFPRRISEQPCP